MSVIVCFVEETEKGKDESKSGQQVKGTTGQLEKREKWDVGIEKLQKPLFQRLSLKFSY